MRADAVMNVVDRVASEIDAIIIKLDEIEAARGWAAGRAEVVLIGYDPRGASPRSEDDPHDPWWCRWKNLQGTGQTCEMAMLDLKSSIERRLVEVVDGEQRRIEEATERLAALRGLLTMPNQEGKHR